MKIEIVKEKLLEAISQAEHVAGKHVSLPVLSSVIIEALKDTVVVKATNLDVGIELTLPAKVEEVGIIALGGSLLKAFLSNAPQGKNILCESIGNLCKVTAGAGEASFNTVSVDDFPVIPKVTEGKTFSINSKEFVGGLRSVVWSAAVSTIKPELGSVYIYEENDDLIFVATDSFRLAERKIKSRKIKEFDPILIPFKNALEIIRVFENLSGELLITITKNQLSIVTEGIHLSSRVIDGNFPDYRQIIPKEFVTKATILKQDLAQVLKLGSLFSDNFHQIMIKFDPKAKTVEFYSKNSEVGESRQQVKGTVEGEEITMPFNHRYLIDCLQSIESESVTLKVGGQSKPMIISPASGAEFTYLVMSMNR
jgi:DNA polymerase-3 subunit beta